jgi:hypothetical protein
MRTRLRRLAVFLRTAIPPDDLGQATTEYALVLLGAALVALVLIGWATGGGGGGRIAQLFDKVLDSITAKLP